MKHPDPIPYDCRLVRGLRRLAEEREFVVTAQRIARECAVPIGEVFAAKLPGDTATLRGIPAIGYGVMGAQPETRPGWAICR